MEWHEQSLSHDDNICMNLAIVFDACCRKGLGMERSQFRPSAQS